jgi:phosphoribosylglycinamide formyltransferase-1
VTPELDHGPVIAQAAVPVLADDTPQSLAARVLAKEHVIYPRAVRWMVEDQLQVDAAGIVRHKAAAPQLEL